MFDDDDEAFFEGSLNEDIERFEDYLNGANIGFVDSDRLEILLDHYLISNQYTKATICADFAISQFSYNVLFHLRKAQAISALGKLKEALNLLANIEKRASPSCELLLTKASIFSQLKDSKNAIKYFNEALELAEPEDSDEIYLDLAMEYQNSGDFKNGVRVLKEAINHNPFNEGAIYELAYCYDQLGEYQNAIQCYSDFIDENPYSFTAWYNLGNTYSKLENYAKAIWAYDFCMLINEDFGPVYFNMGSTYLSLEQFEKSLVCFKRCIELDGEDAMALCYLGEAYEQLNQLEDARIQYIRSIELSPDFPDAWLGLGIVNDLEGNTREAIVLLNKAAELDPENAGIYHVLAGAYEKLGEMDQSEDYYQLSLALDPTDEECLTNYIELLSKLSLTDALAYIHEFNGKIGLNPLGPLLEVNLLWLLGRKEEAFARFALCVESDREKANQLFEINESLSSVQEFVDLSEK